MILFLLNVSCTATLVLRLVNSSSDWLRELIGLLLCNFCFILQRGRKEVQMQAVVMLMLVCVAGYFFFSLSVRLKLNHTSGFPVTYGWCWQGYGVTCSFFFSFLLVQNS